MKARAIKGIADKECINPYLQKWVIRYNFKDIATIDEDVLVEFDYQEVTGHEPTDDEILQIVKDTKLAELMAFDASSAVNEFYIGEQGLWLSPAERTNYLNTLQGAQRLGVTTVVFLGYDIPVNEAMNALDRINLYAMEAKSVTDNHRNTIESLVTVESIVKYDFTVGYPAKVIINFFNN